MPASPALVSNPTTVVAGQKVCIYVEEFVPATVANGSKNDVTVQAAFTYTNASPSLSASYTLHDMATVGSSTLDLKKEVRNVTQDTIAGSTNWGVSNLAKSGETLEYRVTYTNNATGAVYDLKVADTTPSYTTFVSALPDVTPGTLTCKKTTPANPAPANATVPCTDVQTVGGRGSIDFIYSGALAGGASGSILYRVKVD